MAANNDDFLTTFKALTQAINRLADTELSINGVYTTPNVDGATLIKNASGRLATISVIDAGSSDGAIHDINTVAGAASANQIGIIPTAGNPIQPMNLPFLKGLVIVPGTGMTVAVSYS